MDLLKSLVEAINYFSCDSCGSKNTNIQLFCAEPRIENGLKIIDTYKVLVCPDCGKTRKLRRYYGPYQSR